MEMHDKKFGVNTKNYQTILIVVSKFNIT